MRVFVSEYVCSGAWPEAEIGGSLAVEGRAMLEAILTDFARIPGVEVWTTWDRRMGPITVEGVKAVVIGSPEEERRRFDELSLAADCCLLIAPEFDDILRNRCQAVEKTWGRLLGCLSSAVDLCGKKSFLEGFLQHRGINTVETTASRYDWKQPENLNFPMVVKPRDGAGSQSMYLIEDREHFDSLRSTMDADPRLKGAICQKYIVGRSVSVGLIVSRDRERFEVLIPAEQNLSRDGRFRYQGGFVPAREVNHAAIRSTAEAACRLVDGLRGYVGVDLIVPDDAPDRPIVVEINPRLTTSYLGYRALTDENLAERMLFPDRFDGPVKWKQGGVEFDAAGKVRQV